MKAAVTGGKQQNTTAPSPAAGTAYQHGFGGLLSKNNHSGVEEEAKENEEKLETLHAYGVEACVY